jgi:glutamate synthase (NADPH/NADH) small chain
MGEPDASGRRSPVPIEGSKFHLDCDLAVVAVGSGANPILTGSTEGLGLNKWGYITADPEPARQPGKAYGQVGIYVTGSATVILAMGAGEWHPILCINTLHLGGKGL